MRIDVHGIEEVQRMLRAIPQEQVPFAHALGLTKLAQQVKTEEVEEIKRVFDRPTPFTLNSLFVQPATKARQSSRVWLRDYAAKGTPATEYLLPHIEGGERTAKRTEVLLRRQGILGSSEFLVPGSGAPLDQYGNISRGQINTMLSNLRAQWDPYQNTPTGRRTSFFAKRKQGRLIIFRRQGKKIAPFMVGVKTPQYKVIFKFFEVAQRVVDRDYRAVFLGAIAQALRTAR